MSIFVVKYSRFGAQFVRMLRNSLVQLDLVFVPQLYYPMLVRVVTGVCEPLEVSLRDDSKGYDRCSL